MKTASLPTYTIDIFMAGDIAQAKHILRAYCYDVGFCVHIHPADYIYTGGEEAGFKVGVVNYPRFPAEPKELWRAAEEIARKLIEGLRQHTALLVARDRTCWLTRREEEHNASKGSGVTE